MYSAGEYSAAYQVDSVEGPWNSGIFGFGHSVPHKRGYFPVAPFDTLQDLRSEMVRELIDAGVEIELHHHEVGTAGQCEIDMKYDSLVTMADKMQLYKYIVKNVAKRNDKTVTFMPKPIYGDNGSGMHTHQSLWKDGKPLFLRRRLCQPEPDGAVVHWRHSQAHQRPAGHRRPDDQLVPSSCARL